MQQIMKEMGILKETDLYPYCSLPGPPSIKWNKDSCTHSLEMEHHGMLPILLALPWSHH